MTRTVNYRIATYSGSVTVNCDENDDNETIIAKAKTVVTRQAGGSLPYGYESWTVED
jgi:hypothetical protein